MAVAVAFLSPASASAEPCPNEQLRAQSNSTQLPDCRAYELVTPVDKLGLSVDVPTGGSGAGAAVSSDGQRVLYFPIFALLRDQSEGLDGASEATRTSGGWLSTSVAFPTGQEHPNFDYQIETLPLGGTPDLSTLFYDTGVFVGDVAKLVSTRVYARNPDGSFAGVSQNDTGEAVYVGTSADGSHAVFEMTPVRTEEKGGAHKGGILSLYDRVGGETVPVGVDANGSPTSTCGAILGGTDEAQIDDFTRLENVAKFRDAVSSDGSRIFFESPDPRGHLFSSDPGCGQPGEVYVRENAATTTEISRSQKTGSVGAPAPHGAIFEAASADGSRVFFESIDQLTNDAAAASQDLYEYDVQSGVLTFIASGRVYGRGLIFGFAPLLSSDGTHVYFLGNVPGKGPAGQENLYLWDEGRISFISPVPIGGVANTGGTADARVSADGSTLAFTSTSNLTGYDSHGVAEIYVYKANGGSLACISCDPNGAPPAGPAQFFGTVFSTPIASQDVTSDGSRVFFQSPDPLLPGATNGLYNVYEYENGALYLLSDGNGPYASRLVGASGDGTDVIIATYDSLVPQDQDNGNGDLYDVRVGGGFPYLPPAGGCSGDSCQGQPALAPVLPSSSSASYPAGENRAPPVATPVVKPLTRAQKFAKALRACRAKHNKHKRAVCETQARKNYAPPHKAKKTGRKGK
jgi:hypothetical protein